MFATLFSSISSEEKSAAVETIIQRASPRAEFFLMMTLAIGTAMGVVTDSVVVLIGSMLIAPMLYPLLSFSLGIVIADPPVLRRALATLAKATALSLAASFLIGLFFTSVDLSMVRVIAGSIPTLAYAVVAGIAGFAAAFAMTRPSLNEMLPGVAISVALVPPLAVAGIGLAHFDWSIFADAFLLFITNIVGIVLFAVVVFSLMGFSEKRRVVEQAVKQDEKEIKEANDRAAVKSAA